MKDLQHMIIWRPGMTMEDAERSILWQALTHYCGSKRKTARAIGLAEKTVRNKVYQYPELSKFKGQAGNRLCVCGKGCSGTA
jgi:DNA-binding NtrC family response regulator